MQLDAEHKYDQWIAKAAQEDIIKREEKRNQEMLQSQLRARNEAKKL